MVENIKVSILIPVYNREKYISRCIFSALNQTYKNIEIIVVDNCSSDSTWDICKEMASQDCRIKIYQNQTNIGPVRNWIRCSELATGEYCKILFSDDELDNRCISQMLPKILSHDTGLVYSTVNIGPTVYEFNSVYDPKSHNNYIKSKDFISLVLRGKAPVSPGAYMIRTKDLKNNIRLGFKTHIIHEFSEHGAGPDVMILFYTMEKYEYVCYIKEPLIFFRIHPESISVSNFNNRIQESYRAVFSFYILEKFGSAKWRSYVSYVWLLDLFRGQLKSPLSYFYLYGGKVSFISIFQFAGSVISLLVKRLIRNKPI